MEAKIYDCKGKDNKGKDNKYSDDENSDATFALNLTENKLFKQYCHDIRNSKKINREILEKINNLSYENRLEILILYNKMIEYYKSLLLLLD